MNFARAGRYVLYKPDNYLIKYTIASRIKVTRCLAINSKWFQARSAIILPTLKRGSPTPRHRQNNKVARNGRFVIIPGRFFNLISSKAANSDKCSRHNGKKGASGRSRDPQSWHVGRLMCRQLFWLFIPLWLFLVSSACSKQYPQNNNRVSSWN